MTHLLFKFIFPIIDGDGVVVSVEAVYESLNGGLVEMTKVRRGLPGLLTQHHHVGINQPECIDYNLKIKAISVIQNHLLERYS